MKRFKNILYVNQADTDQTPAVERAVSLAENNQAKLAIVRVIPPVTEDLRKETLESHMQILENLAKPYQKRVKISLEVQTGMVFIEAIRTVLRNAHDLLIKTAENPDFLKRLFGSDDIHLLRKCPCPVWVMKSPEKANYNCIMAAVDFDPLKSVPVEQTLNQEILDLASSLALSEFASLHLIHAWEAFPAGTRRSRSENTAERIAAYIEREHALHQNVFHRLGEELRERIGTEAYEYLSPRFHLTRGDAQKKIAAMADELRADLVVMGTVARTGVSGFIIGNTAEAVLEQLQCSVLAVKPPGFVTPVKLSE